MKEELINKLLEEKDKIFFYCIKRCNSRSDAEDLSQEILLDIIININKGIEIKNFDYYIWQICKNHYSKYISKKVSEKNNLSFMEEIDEPGNDSSSLDKLIKDEKVSMMNASIKLLSSDYADILYSYYIEDNSLTYISEKLNLPLGTVKRRLFDIRNKLKEYLKMERLNGKKAFVPTNFYTSMSGGGKCNPHEHAKSLINKNILFHSYDNPCTLEDYSLELGIAIPYIKPIVEELTAVTLLTKQGNKYITNFPVITKENDIALVNVLNSQTKTYGEKLVTFCKNNFNKFKSIINNDHFTDNELMWVFMFYINRIAEQWPINEKDGWYENKFRHKVDNDEWNFHMTEIHDQTVNYFISENWFGNKELNIQGIIFPFCNNTCEDEIFNTISYNNGFDIYSTYTQMTLEYLEYVIKNENLRYSEIKESNKYKIDDLIRQNLIYIENDEIKFNFILLSKSTHELLNSYFEYHEDLKEIKEERNKILNKLREVVTTFLPSYLSVDTEYLVNGYFYSYIRPVVIKCFEGASLIKPNKIGKRFNFNMYAWKFND